MKITIKYEQGYGLEKLVVDSMSKKKRLVWIPFRLTSVGQ